MLSEDGRFRPEIVKAACKILSATNPSATAATIDLDATYTNEFLNS
jgi:hypothetical protein